MTERQNTIILAVFLLVVGGYTFLAFVHPVAYIWATYEDLVGEWMQTYFFLVGAVLSALVAVRDRRHRWFFSVLALACGYVFLEEISWGQRILGFSTPGLLKEHNLQGEANLHNLFTGPYKTLLKDVISVVLAAGLVGFGLLLPLLNATRSRLSLWLDRIGVASPPLVLAPYFVTAAYLELKPFSFNEAEVAELLVAAALAMFALDRLLMLDRARSKAAIAPASASSARPGKPLIVMALLVVAAAGSTTFAMYSLPDSRARIDNRIENGIEKFAGRYERYDRWDIASELYGVLLQKEPERVYIMRKLAVCHRELGQSEIFTDLAMRAIEKDLERYAKEPWRASVNQSLVRSYRLIGDGERAGAHLEEALDIGISRISKYPDSASAAYSFGRSLQLAGRDHEAFEQFARAYELKPAKSRYRKAYFSLRADLGR